MISTDFESNTHNLILITQQTAKHMRIKSVALYLIFLLGIV